MTGISTRDVGFLRWKDERAWMETMRGPRWRKRVEDENRKFEEAVVAVAEKELVESSILQFETAVQEAEVGTEWRVGDIRILEKWGGGYKWSWLADTLEVAERRPLVGGLACGAGAAADTVYYSVEVKEGEGKYKIVAEKRAGGILWSYGGRGPSVDTSLYWKDGYVYFLEGDADLQYTRFVRLDAADGKGRRVLYEEKDDTMMLSLTCGENGCLFLEREGGNGAEGFREGLLHVLDETGEIRELCPGARRFFPVGAAAAAPTDPCFLVKREATAPWEVHGRFLRGWKFPREFLEGEAEVEQIILWARLIVLKQHGRRLIYSCKGRGAPPKLLTSFVGTVEFNEWVLCRGEPRGGPIEALFTFPGSTPVKGVLGGGADTTLKLTHPLSLYGKKGVRGWAKSADGTRVAWHLCINDSQPVRGVIITVYGSYGLDTSLSTARWKPYLERGVAIGFVFVRGGGDHTIAWEEAGKGLNKERGIEDFEAGVRSIRGHLRLGAEATCVYGRSAGGYIVGTAVARNRQGGLFGNAYVEVPYVDVLRTASNPGLPLTKYEYEEFGDPAHRVEDFELLLRLSPIEALGEGGAPGVFVLCRTGEKDKNVFAYESVKWVDALRGVRGLKGSKEKLVAIGKGQAHFSHGGAVTFERTEDYLVLCEKILKKN